MKIGFIGLGIMGKPMAKNLLKAGYTDLLVNNRRQAPVQELEAAGAKGATQQEIAQSLFRLKRLGRSEWQVSPIRHSVMSLLRDARSMISGGYRKLLRHRRKP